MIRFEHVTKRYSGGTVAVDDLDLVTDHGKITVFVGPSGCGKTTCLRMINRMVEPTSGKILLDGVDTASMAPHELRRGIGYVIQHAGLFPHRTVVDNIATVPDLLGQHKKASRARAMELLERVGLPAHFAKRYPRQLSDGQQQRVGLARALAADPPVLLMDEPFSAIDNVAREQLQDRLLELQRDLAKTIVFVTHDIDEAIKVGDQVAVLRVGGRLAQLSSPAELLARPVDAFVASFVGRDRGYRALGFSDPLQVRTRREPTASMGAGWPRTSEFGPWMLAVDAAGAPQGWLNLAAGRVGDTVSESLLHRGGTVFTQGGSLRTALDACLSSPSGRGVVVDASGALVGTMELDDVISRIEGQDLRVGALGRSA